MELAASEAPGEPGGQPEASAGRPQEAIAAEPRHQKPAQPSSTAPPQAGEAAGPPLAPPQPQSQLEGRTASQQLAVADWQPGSKQAPADGQPPGGPPAGELVGRQPQPEASDATTVSDAEQEAAAALNAVRAQSPAGTQRKRSASPLGAGGSPKKARRPSRKQQQEAAESDAIAALEQIRNGVHAKPQQPAPAQQPQGSLPGSAEFLEAASRLPPGTLQMLAQLVGRQRAAGQAQDATAAAGAAAQPAMQQLAVLAALQRGGAPHDVLRSCVSESSAERLLGQQQNGGAGRLDLRAAGSAPEPTRQRSGSGQLAGAELDLSRRDPPQPGSVFAGQAQQPAPARPPSEAKRDLASFGSFISTALDASRRGSGQPPQQGNGPLPIPGGAKPKPERAHASQAPASQEGSGQLRNGGAPLIGSAPAAAGGAAGVPDPRILEWVLGNRGSLTDRGRHKPSTATEGLAAVQARFPPVGEHAAAAALQPTLRRPIAIRAADMQEAHQPQAQPRPEALLEGLLGHAQPAAQAAAEGGVQPPTAGDLGRVMQWAGAELALRDRKVREAERAREEAQRAHDAAMTAVGTEVARLKRGQAELAVTHWTLQESLAHKDAELAEKTKALAQLSAGLGELTQQGLAAAKEAQRLQARCEALSAAARAREAELLAELGQLEQAAKEKGGGMVRLIQAARERLCSAAAAASAPQAG